MEGVATTDSGQAFADALDRPVLLHGLDEVHAAGRREAAVATQHGTEHDLVKTHQQNQYPGQDGSGNRVILSGRPGGCFAHNEPVRIPVVHDASCDKRPASRLRSRGNEAAIAG